MENVTLAVAKSYAEELLMGQGAIQGADGKDGADGVDGFSPIIVENASNTDEVYKLDITTKDGTFTTANLIGKQGVQGIQGERGEQGETGLQGQQGIQGVKGDKGDDGYPFLIYKQYEVGLEEFNEADYPEIGLMFMVHVFEEDKGYPVYRYTADGTDTPYSLVTYMNTEGIKGEKGDKGDAGEQGIAGLDGKDGKDGTTYTPSIGEVTTVESDIEASATVSIKEETKEAVFNFAIPKGNKGIDGKDGVQIDDTTTSTDTVWSSKKTSDEIAKVDTELNAKLGELSELKTTKSIKLTRRTKTYIFKDVNTSETKRYFELNVNGNVSHSGDVFFRKYVGLLYLYPWTGASRGLYLEQVQHIGLTVNSTQIDIAYGWDENGVYIQNNGALDLPIDIVAPSSWFVN